MAQQPKFKVGELLLTYRQGKSVLGIITAIVDNKHDPFNLYLYKVNWNDGQWWKYTEDDTMKFKGILEWAKDEQPKI
jgi:hypothetical protein